MQPADPSFQYSSQHSSQTTPWQVVHALAVGTSHLSSGLACQDAADWRILPSGLLAIALADGAGSAPESETGANLAVTEALMTLENAEANDTPGDANAWAKAVQEAFFAARQALADEAQTAGLPLQAFATTLICVVAAGDGLVLGQVGDGVLVARTSRRRFTYPHPAAARPVRQRDLISDNARRTPAGLLSNYRA